VEVIIPEPNPALTELLVSVRMREIVFDRAVTGQMLYQVRVAKESTKLARTARAFTEIGGKRQDRWIGTVLVGEGLEYGASHEFGYTTRRGTRARRHKVAGTLDLNHVLGELGSL
jgi:phage gpG-like protein